MIFSEKVAEDFWKKRAEQRSADASRFHSEHTPYDQSLIGSMCIPGMQVLDLGCGDCVISNWLVIDRGVYVRAVDKQAGFLEAALKHPCMTTEQSEAIGYHFTENYDLILMLGLINFIPNPEVRLSLYADAIAHLKPGGHLLIKSQFGIEQQVEVNSFSDALHSSYSAVYPHISAEMSILNSMAKAEARQLYPPELNPHKNTRFYHIVVEA